MRLAAAQRGIVDRDHGRAKQHVARCRAAANSARQSLSKAHTCVDRANHALRLVEDEESDRATQAEAAADAVRRAHGRCLEAAKTAGAAASHGDACGAEQAAGQAAGALKEAQAQATLAGRLARAKR